MFLSRISVASFATKSKKVVRRSKKRALKKPPGISMTTGPVGTKPTNANFYLFRNLISNRVICSPQFRINETHLWQIGSARNQLKLRPDHWTPFLILTGLTMRQQKIFINNLTLTKQKTGPKSETRLPLQRGSNQFPGWSISDDIKKAVKTVSETLFEMEKFQTTAGFKLMQDPVAIKKSKRALKQFMLQPAAKRRQWARQGLKPDLVPVYKTLGPLQEFKIVLHWARQEFQLLNEFPESVTHTTLELRKNRYPVIPGFDGRKNKDITLLSPPIKKLTIADFRKKPTTWKVKNKIVEKGTLFKYGSKNGKSFPILKTTRATSRFKHLREEKMRLRKEKEDLEKARSKKSKRKRQSNGSF